MNNSGRVIVDSEIFKYIVKKKIGGICKIAFKNICSERSIRRSLEKHSMDVKFLEEIARQIDVDPRLLSGEYYNMRKKYDNPNDDYEFKKAYLSCLVLDKYPYFNKEKADFEEGSIDSLLKNIFALFDISFPQFKEMDFETQCKLQREIFKSLAGIIGKYFDVDAYGRKGLPDLYEIIARLDSFIDDHYFYEYVKTDLRKKYAENPPLGYNAQQILNMDAEKLITLDMDIHETKKRTEKL